ncbi:hypothetical protein [Thiolapillus sp.]
MEQNLDGRPASTRGHDEDGPCLRERQMFRLLLQSNPNYFGTRSDSLLPVKMPICCNRHYEEISCVVWDRKAHSLAAIIVLHGSSGYAGGTRMSRTPEHVRFFLSLDEGKTWQDQGHASVEVENAPGDGDRHYAVSLEPKLSAEEMPGDVHVRAILAWDDIPPAGQPEWKPVFGMVHDALLRDGVGEAAPLLAAGLGGRYGNNMLAVVRLTPDDLASRRFRHLSFWAGRDGSGRFDYCLGSLALEEDSAEHVVMLPLDLLDCRRACAENSTLLRAKLVLSAEPVTDGDLPDGEEEASRVAEACLTIPPEVKAGAGEIALIGGYSAREIHVAELQLEDLDGDEILVQGVSQEGHSYVVEVSDDGLNWRPLLKSFTVMDRRGRRTIHRPDAQSGHFRYLPHERNVLGILARWDNPRPGKWRVRLRVYMQGILLPESDQVMVRVGENVCRPSVEPGEEDGQSGHDGLSRGLVNGCILAGTGLVNL